VLYQRVSGCYAHSAIPGLAFRLATVIAKMCGAMHFRYSAMTHHSSDYSLPLNIWQRVIEKDTKKTLRTRFLRKCPDSGPCATECALENINWSDCNIGGYNP